MQGAAAEYRGAESRVCNNGSGRRCRVPLQSTEVQRAVYAIMDPAEGAGCRCRVPRVQRATRAATDLLSLISKYAFMSRCRRHRCSDGSCRRCRVPLQSAEVHGAVCATMDPAEGAGCQWTQKNFWKHTGKLLETEPENFWKQKRRQKILETNDNEIFHFSIPAGGHFSFPLLGPSRIVKGSVESLISHSYDTPSFAETFRALPRGWQGFNTALFLVNGGTYILLY